MGYRGGVEDGEAQVARLLLEPLLPCCSGTQYAAAARLPRYDKPVRKQRTLNDY